MKPSAIKIRTTENLPNDVLRRLHLYDDVFREKWSIHQILEVPDLRIIAEKLHDICIQNHILGYHYTRANKDNIWRDGLVPLSGEERRRAFLELYGHKFSTSQRERIHTSWNDYFTPYMSKIRDGRVCFNFTFVSLNNGNAENLLKYYGGEVVYFPLIQDHEIEEILTTLGDPLLVECLLKPIYIETSHDIPWGKIWLSSYHISLNPDADQFDIDAYQKVAVRPDQIKSIENIGPNSSNQGMQADAAGPHG
jgi:hypothetical protein